jgi:Lar family restriction alleviation protein
MTDIATELAALAPCPFCGSPAKVWTMMGESLWSHNIVPWTRVACTGCEVEFPSQCEGSEPDPITAWNARALASRDWGGLVFPLRFHSSAEYPTEEGDYLLYNQCDGYHFATAYILDGKFDCFMDWNSGVYEPDWYCAWAKLPESHTDLFDLFASKAAPLPGAVGGGE